MLYEVITLEQPFHRLERDAGGGPRGGVARGDLACVGEAGFQCRAVLTVDHGDLRAALRQEVCGTGANHPATQNDDIHERPRNNFV